MNSELGLTRVTVVLTQKCNLRCTYCYEHEKSDAVLSVQEALKAIDSAFCRAKKQLEIKFFGGEPFMAFPEMKAIFDGVVQKEQPVPYFFSTITNGTRFTTESKDWLRANKKSIAVALSLDGTPEMHNQNRSGSFGQIDLPFFRENWPDVPVKMTVSPETLPNMAEGVEFLHKQGFKVRGGLAGGIQWPSGTHEEYLKQLMMIAQFHLRTPKAEPNYVLPTSFDLLPGATAFKRIAWCGSGRSEASIGMDGKEYPCQMFVSNEQRADDRTLDKVKKILGGKAGTLIEDKCVTCAINPLCNSTCYGLNYASGRPMISATPEDCTFNMIEAKVAASMMFMMIQHREAYPFVRNMTDSEISNMLEGIRIVDKAIPSNRLIARMTGQKTDLGL